MFNYVLLERLQQHFTPSEFMEFLRVEWETLLDNDNVLDLIEENATELRKEIGID